MDLILIRDNRIDRSRIRIRGPRTDRGQRRRRIRMDRQHLSGTRPRQNPHRKVFPAIRGPGLCRIRQGGTPPRSAKPRVVTENQIARGGIGGRSRRKGECRGGIGGDFSDLPRRRSRENVKAVADPLVDSPLLRRIDQRRRRAGGRRASFPGHNRFVTRLNRSVGTGPSRQHQRRTAFDIPKIRCHIIPLDRHRIRGL